MLFSSTSLANALYHSSANCKALPNSGPIKILTKVQGKLHSNEYQQLTQKATDKTLEKIFSLLPKYSNGLMISSASYTGRLNLQSMRIYVNATLQQVGECEFEENVITQKDIKTIYKLEIANFDIVNKATIEISQEVGAIKDRLAEQYLENNTVSAKNIFGIQMGDSISEAKRKIGRFSLTWPLDNGIKLLTIGRRHALFFDKDILVGYQYSESLLPIVLRNKVELIGEEVFFELSDSMVVSMDGEITKQQATLLREKFRNVTLHNVADAFTEEQSLKVSSLALGRVHFDTFNNILSCINFKKDSHTLVSSSSPIIEFVNIDNRLSYLSGCRQLLTMNQSLKIHKLELLDSLSSHNAELYHVKELFNSFTSWQFLDVSEGGSVQQLEVSGNVSYDFDQVEYENGAWYGMFYVEGERLIAAELTSTHL